MHRRYTQYFFGNSEDIKTENLDIQLLNKVKAVQSFKFPKKHRPFQGYLEDVLENRQKHGKEVRQALVWKNQYYGSKAVQRWKYSGQRFQMAIFSPLTIQDKNSETSKHLDRFLKI